VNHVFEIAVGTGGDFGNEVVKGSEDGDFRDDGDGEAVLLDAFCVSFADFFGFALGADGGDDGVVFGEELFEDVGFL
jgi:hypothetical protein